MTLEEYLPRQPRYVSLRALARVIAKRLRRAATVLAKVFMPFEANPQGATREYPESDVEMVEAQVTQCKRVFDLSEERAKALDARIDSLLKTLALVVPVAVAAVAYLWREAPALPRIGFVGGFVCLLGSLVAILRAGGIRVSYVPGIDAVVDVVHHVRRPYGAAREGYGLLWCGLMNIAASDLKYDFLRASRILVSIALIFLLSSGLILVAQGSPQQSDARRSPPNSQQATLANQIAELSRLQAQRIDQLEGLIAQQAGILAEARLELKRLREIER
jgi:hypothetical protein